MISVIYCKIAGNHVTKQVAGGHKMLANGFWNIDKLQLGYQCALIVSIVILPQKVADECLSLSNTSVCGHSIKGLGPRVITT